MRAINSYRVTITMHNNDVYEIMDYGESPRTPEPNRHGFIPVPQDGSHMVYLGAAQVRDIKIEKVDS